LYLQGWVLSAPDENIHLPAPNKFIPTDLSLKTVPEKVLHIFHFYVVIYDFLHGVIWTKLLIL
jgi:insulysin